jgi:hypothetical protein
VGQIDVNDDSVIRYVLKHYKFDPSRNEYRHVVIGVFSKKREFKKLLKIAKKELESKTGDQYRREYISGEVIFPGDLEKKRHSRFIKRLIAHGVSPDKYTGNNSQPKLLIK